VHNTFVVRELEKKGLKVISSLEQITSSGTLAISAHGAAPHVLNTALKTGMKILDTTCPKVLRAQKQAKAMSLDGCRVFILGDENHPEVKGISGFCNNKTKVINIKKPLPQIDKSEKIGLVAQTTQSILDFKNICKAINIKTDNFYSVNTICLATQERQKAALELAKKVDLMLVIGDKKSANTKRLYELCKTKVETFQIQSINDLQNSWFDNINTVGITAGASTPKNIIDDVIKELSKN